MKRCRQLVRKALIIGYLHITKNMDLVCNRAISLYWTKGLYSGFPERTINVYYTKVRGNRINGRNRKLGCVFISYDNKKKSPWASLDILANVVSSLALWLLFRFCNGTPHEMIVLLFPDFQLFICVLKKHKCVMRKTDEFRN